VPPRVVLGERGFGGEELHVVGVTRDLRDLLVVDGERVGHADLEPEGVGRLCQRAGAVEVPCEDRVHAAAGRREVADERRTGLLGNQLESRQLALHPDDVTRLECGRQSPQVRVHPGAYIIDVRRDVLESRADVQPLGQIVRAPAGGELGIERVREQDRISGVLRKLDRFESERHTATGVVAIDPRTRQRGGETRSGDRFVPRREVGLVQESGRATTGTAEALK
jgi:hypothetical protein